MIPPGIGEAIASEGEAIIVRFGACRGPAGDIIAEAGLFDPLVVAGSAWLGGEAADVFPNPLE